MGRVLVSLAVVVLSLAAFIWGLTGAQALPLTCGFLLWSPAVFFLGWTAGGMLRGRRVRFVVAQEEAVTYVQRPAASPRPARREPALTAEDYVRLMQDEDGATDYRVSGRR